jgi:hypothetical protein
MYFLLVKKSIEMINLIKQSNFTIPYSCNLLLDDINFIYDNNILNQFLKKEYDLNMIIENIDDNILLMEIENIWFIIIVREEISFIEMFISSFENKEDAFSYLEEFMTQ